MEQDVRRFWEKEARAHAETAYRYYAGGAPQRYPFFEVRRDRFVEILEPLPPGKILDAGCGSGEILLECLARGWDGFGCDVAEAMVGLARGLMTRSGREPDRVRRASITDLSDYDDAEFDAVACLGVLEYLREEEEERAFAEFRRVLRDGGTLIVENVNGLFDLFTFNRFTVEFFRRSILPIFFPSAAEVEAVADRIGGLITHPEKPDRVGRFSSTRDQVYNRVEIPFAYGEKVARYGFSEERQVFYRFHAVPPLLFERDPSLEKVSIPLEKALSTHWIRYLAATGFLSILRKNA